MRAVWNDTTIAESEQTVVVEGNHYFPPDSIEASYFEESDTLSTCRWKGQANYYHLAVGGERNENAAWYYRQPKEEAAQIKGHVAFWKGVEVIE